MGLFYGRSMLIGRQFVASQIPVRVLASFGFAFGFRFRFRLRFRFCDGEIGFELKIAAR